MQFFRPEYFLYLWIVPAVFLFYVFSRKLWQKRTQRLVRDEALLAKLVEGYRKNEWLTRAIFMTLAVLCFVLALARPQWGDEKRTAQRKGVDLVFLVDTSLSMLAEDIKPNRLEKAKFEIETFIRNLRGDRVGMVTFAGSGFLQTPLTLDHAAFLLFLDSVQVGFLPDPGTSLVQAIHLAIRAFPQKELKYKALILFTDGEDHEGGVEKAIEEARQANVRIYCIGLGNAEGEPIPLKNEKGERSGFKKDRSGQMVLTRLNQALLERLAKETGGIYLPATPGEKEVEIILKHLRGWGEQQFEEKMIVEREDQYQTFLVLAFIFLIAEMLVRRKNGNGKHPAMLACLAAFFLFTGFLGSSQDTVKKGNDLYQNKRYQSALESYRKVQVKNPDAPEVLYNLGTTLYKVDSLQESAQDLDAAAKKAQDPKLKARALYNNGNVLYRLGNFEEAIDAYKQALTFDPTDKDAKYNLEFLQKQKNKMDKKDQEQKKNDPKKNDQQNKDQKKDQQQQQQNQQNKDQKQNQGGGQGQQDKDKKDQDQQGGQDQQNKDQQQQQKQPKPQDQQDQKDQQPQPKPEDQPQDKKDQQQQQQQKEQEQKEKEKQEEQKKQQEQQQKEKEEQEKKEQQEQQNQQEQKKNDQKDEPQGQQQRPLQGQMSMENAMNILDALKESEKELQDLRRPPVNKNPPPVEKDW